MTLLIVVSLVAGLLAGYLFGSPEIGEQLGSFASYALYLLMFCIGVDLGHNRRAWSALEKTGLLILWVPISIAVGSLAGSLLAGSLLRMPHNESLAVGAGFGWYSFSGVLLSEIFNAEVGAIAFMSNIFREFLAFIVMPLAATRLGHLAVIAPGGATTMDTTLPMISKLTNQRITIIAFFSGAMLSAMVPILIPLLINL